MNFELTGPISASVISTLIIVAVLATVFILVGIKVKRLDPAETPKGFVFVCIEIVGLFNRFIKDYMTGKRFKLFAPYFFTIIVFLVFANTAALFGLAPPLSNISVAVAFSILTFFAIKLGEIRFLGIWKKVKSLVGPVWWLFPISLPTNLVGEISTPFSMGLRLFVNLFAGVIMSTMVFASLHWGFSIIAGVFLHGIFDVFFGLIQAFVFFMLSVVNIALASEA
jgi:F-type H+-transporting ATPase subunit a